LDNIGHLFPLDLGAKGTCNIGGILATNAGGINFIRHNSLHANTIGLKAVLPDGKIFDNMTTLRKDNTGYDLKHLFIGAEGTLGIITEAAILCPASTPHKNMAFIACKSFEDVTQILIKAKKELADILNAVEFMDSITMNLVRDVCKAEDKFPFSEDYPFYAMVEIASSGSSESSQEEHVDKGFERLSDFLEKIEDNMVDGVVADDSN
jgi:D-lactate dehydrogenase (cytochrome)